MNGSLANRAAIALATAGAATALWSTVVPDQQTTTPTGRQQQLEDQYGTQRERGLEGLREEARLSGEADSSEQLRAAERRRARTAARRVIRRP